MPPNIDLHSSPLAVELSGILDVLADIDCDLACSSEQETITRRLHDLMMRDRQGLERAIDMLKQFAARHQQYGYSAFHDASREAEGIGPEYRTNVIASSR